jgi:CubicO group peptidase (beta-lactamase class C family)
MRAVAGRLVPATVAPTPRKEISMRSVKLVIAAALLFITSLPMRAAHAQTPRSLDDAQALESFADSFFAKSLPENNIAGAAVSIVYKGRVLLVKGYGKADIAGNRAMDGDKTLLRPGSISKLFTATAVAQLVHAKKLDLDADVNTYLKTVRVPEAFGKPVTLRQLLTHSAGFEEQTRGTFARDAASRMALAESLQARLPRRIRPPGVVPGYSNHGLALAGLVVQDVSGMPYEDYIAQFVLRPLGMNDSSMAQPLPSALAARMSAGYDEALQPQPFEFVEASPAGALSSTARDMTRFMLAFLQDGVLDGKAVFAPEIPRMMLTRQLATPEAVPAIGLSFYQERKEGRLLWGHGGDTLFFHSGVWLFPDESLGIFVSQNSAGNGNAPVRREFLKQFINAFGLSREKGALPKPDVQSIAHINAIAGGYRNTRVSTSTFLKLGALANSSFWAKPDGRVEGGLALIPIDRRTMVETAPFVFQFDDPKLDGGYAFSSDGVYAYDTSTAIDALERAAPGESDVLHLPIALFALLMFLSVLIGTPIAALLRRLRKRPLAATKDSNRARVVRYTAAAIGIAFVAALIALLSTQVNEVMLSGPTLFTYLTFGLGLLMIPAALALSFYAVHAWHRGWWTLGRRIHYTLLALAAAGFVFFLNTWKLLGLHV